MRVPFVGALDTKSVIVGIVIAYFVIPFILGLINSRKGSAATV